MPVLQLQELLHDGSVNRIILIDKNKNGGLSA
jgi:hypothetical protein